MTDKQREKLNEAFDILCELYKEMKDIGCNVVEVKRLDTILGKVEQLMWLHK